jgi:tyrosine-protein kinase Etk/Wzc
MPGDLPASLQRDLPPVQPAPFLAGPAGGRPSSGRRITEDGEGFDWRRYLAAILRRKWLVILAVALGTGGGIMAARTLRPQFLAQATVWIESGNGRGGDSRGPIRSARLLQSLGWVELLRSYMVLDHAVQELRLYLGIESAADSAVFESFELTGDVIVPDAYRLAVGDAGRVVMLFSSSGILVDRVEVGASIGASVGFGWLPPPSELEPGREVDFSVSTPRDAARALGNALRARTDATGDFMRVELSGPSPTLITATVNAVVARYVDVAASLKRDKLSELATILEDQLRQAERNLREAEIALESFRVNTVTLPSERASPLAAGLELTRDPVFDSFFEIKVARDQTVRDREALQRALGQVSDSGLSVDALEAVEAVQQSREIKLALEELTDKRAELRALRYGHTEEFPAVQQLTDDVRRLERVTIPERVRELMSELQARQDEYDSRIASASQELQQVPPRAIQEARLERDVTVAENLYTMLQQRYEEARLAEASSIPDVRVLDAAVVPSQPVRNRAGQLIAMGFMAGLGLGVFGAVLLDRIDRRVQYAEQITTDLALPLLGAIPHVQRMNRARRTGKTDALVIEALRGVRLNVVHAHGAAGPILLTVTSPDPGDGKSFVASNLALAFASAGHRTLLIDGDSRRGRLHHVLNLRRKPGLVDLLTGSVALGDVVQEAVHDALHFIGGGTRRQEAPELLGSGAMGQLITDLRSSFSVIIVDSPPLSAGIDAYSLATTTGNAVIVLRLGATDREVAEAKLDVLDRLPVRVLGAVLNDLRGGNAYRYYSYGLEGYETQAEVGGPGQRLLTGAK